MIGCFEIGHSLVPPKYVRFIYTSKVGQSDWSKIMPINTPKSNWLVVGVIVSKATVDPQAHVPYDVTVRNVILA